VVSRIKEVEEDQKKTKVEIQIAPHLKTIGKKDDETHLAQEDDESYLDQMLLVVTTNSDDDCFS